MTKKALILLFTLSFVFIFAACNKDNNKDTDSITSTTNSKNDINKESSKESSKQTSSETSKATSSEESILNSEVSDAEVSTGTVAGVYNGDGYSFKIPNNFKLYDEVNGIVTFTTTSGSQLSIATLKNASGIQTNTKEQLAASFSAIFGDLIFKDYKNVKVDGKNADYFLFSIEAESVPINYYTASIYTDKNIFTVTLSAYNVEMEKEFNDMMATFSIK